METFAGLSPEKVNATVPSRGKNKPFFSPATVQPKLTINQPNDSYEQEADAMADKVMRMEQPGVQLKPLPISAVQRKCAHCEEEEKKMQRKEINGQGKTAGSNLESYVGRLSGSGQSLPKEVRSFYEPRFGYDFSTVKIHTDTVAAKSAQSINALAYTSGNNIVFNEGQYSPDTDSGKRLLGHELTHVVQQNQNTIQRKKLTKEEKAEDLQSDMLKDDNRLQQAFDDSPLMYRNEVSEGVKTLQRALKRLGYPLPVSFKKTGDADGVFGDETSAQVKQFQRDNGLNDEGIIGRDTLRALDSKFNPVITIEAVYFTEDNRELIENETDWGFSGNKYADWAGVPYHILFEPGQLFAKSIPVSVNGGKKISGIAKAKVKGGIPGDIYSLSSKPLGNSQGSAGAFTVSGDGTFNNVPGEETNYIFLQSSGSLPNKISADDFFLTWQLDAAGKSNSLPVSHHTVFTVSNMSSNNAAVRGSDMPNIPTFKRMQEATKLAKDQPTDDPGKIAFKIMKRFPNYGACAAPYDPQWDTPTFKCPQIQSVWEMADFSRSQAHFQCITIAHFTNAVLNVLGVPNTLAVSVDPVVIWADESDPKKGIESPGHQYSKRHPDHPDWFLILVDGNCGLNNFEACVKLKWITPGGVNITQYYCGGVSNKEGGFKDPDEILHAAFISLSYVKRMSANDPRTGFPRGIRERDLAVYNATDECKRENP